MNELIFPDDSPPPNELLERFAIGGALEKLTAYGNGHINKTYLSEWTEAGTRRRYIHQRINEKVFARPHDLMRNIALVTGHIREKAAKDGRGDPARSTLTIVPAENGDPLIQDRHGGWWRTYFFIDGSRSLELASTPDDARLLGESIAQFQNDMSDFSCASLYETIPSFHDMEKRYAFYRKILSMNQFGRTGEAKEEIDFMAENESRGAILARALRSGELPVRTCHNDAKINNILIDSRSSESLCVIDLDTVMGGTVLFDFGDLVRTACASSAEDKPDLSKQDFRIDFFRSLLSGYLSRAGSFLVPSELALLCEAGRNITHIMGLRFLTDFLDGDNYYHIDRPGHNLDRCRTQIALIKSMDSKWKIIMEACREECARMKQ